MMYSKKKWSALLLAAGLGLCLLSGCADTPAETAASGAAQGGQEGQSTEATAAEPTTPADGNPEDVTCKGSYTGVQDADAVVAEVGDVQLTNGQLQVYYWAEVAAYRQEEHEQSPDFDQSLDTQVCEIDDSVASWQQYFLKRALNAWHSAQALMQQGVDEGLPTEEAYQPDLEKYEEYMAGMPATQFLYRYNTSYSPNTMHQAYLDEIPDLLEELAQEKGYASAEDLAQTAFGASAADVEDFVYDVNWGYMYFTNLSYYIEDPAEEEVQAYFSANEDAYAEEGITRSSGRYVNIRHILLIPEETEEQVTTVDADGQTVTETQIQPVVIADDGTVTCSEAAWAACEEQANDLLEQWAKDTVRTPDAAFAEIANKNSADSGSSNDGGAYCHIQQGQLIAELDDWCFDESRQEGDTVIIRTDYGYHILYFTSSEEIWYAEAEEDLIVQYQQELITAAREAYPMEVDYSAITLTEAAGDVSTEEILYPDVAHERFPEVPLYLQQDYPNTMYGSEKIRTHGCGITTMAMLATYMADDELTPPEMCARFGKYSYSNGTDGSLFVNEPAGMGFYLKEKTWDHNVAYAALEEGYIVVSIQHEGYWTTGGHYIVLEKLNEDGTIQVRDSNIYNYSRLRAAHSVDSHTWGSIVNAGSAYWIYEKKVTTIPACVRCGEEGEGYSILAQDYYCEKCRPAMLRRSTYLAAFGS